MLSGQCSDRIRYVSVMPVLTGVARIMQAKGTGGKATKNRLWGGDVPSILDRGLGRGTAKPREKFVCFYVKMTWFVACFNATKILRTGWMGTFTIVPCPLAMPVCLLLTVSETWTGCQIECDLVVVLVLGSYKFFVQQCLYSQAWLQKILLCNLCCGTYTSLSYYC